MVWEMITVTHIKMYNAKPREESPKDAPFIKNQEPCVKSIHTYKCLWAKSSNICKISMIKIQVTICIHKKNYIHIYSLT